MIPGKTDSSSDRSTPIGLFSYFSRISLAWGGVSLCWYLLNHRGTAQCSDQSACDVVLNSKFSTFLGIYLPYYGAAFYLLYFILTNAAALSMNRRRKPLLDGWDTKAVTAAGFLFSVVLLFIQASLLHTFCPYCLASFTIATLLFLSELFFPSSLGPTKTLVATVCVSLPLATVGGWMAGSQSPPDPVVYKIDGTEFRESSLMPGMAVALQPFQDAIYETSREFVEESIQARLISIEARRAGLDEKSYEESLFGEKVQISDQEIATAFAPNQPPERDSSLWHFAERALLQRKISGLRNTLDETLRAKHKVEILLKRATPATIKVDYRYVVTDGPDSAPVHLVALSDFECPYCATMAATMRRMRARFGDRLQIGFWNVPLSIHAHARIAAVASLCAEKQGAFWQYHDKLFGISDLSIDRLVDVAAQLRLEASSFRTCLTDSKMLSQVEDSSDAARNLGVESTPSVFLNGQLIGGVLSDEDLSDRIQSVLQKQ